MAGGEAEWSAPVLGCVYSSPYPIPEEKAEGETRPAELADDDFRRLKLAPSPVTALLKRVAGEGDAGGVSGVAYDR